MSDTTHEASTAFAAGKRKADHDSATSRGRGGGRGGHGGHDAKRRKHVTAPENASPCVKFFAGLANSLTEKQDRHERIVKSSRDTTIASKRAIFSLHRLSEENREQVLQEAKQLLGQAKQSLTAITEEVGDPSNYFQYHRAFSPGVQEFVEASTFFYFLETGSLASLEQLSEDAPMLKAYPSDYLLGVMDLTGELMRYCINMAGTNDDMAQQTCSFGQNVLASFMLLDANTVGRDFPKKLEVMKSSVQKMENAVYSSCVRAIENLPARPGEVTSQAT